MKQKKCNIFKSAWGSTPKEGVYTLPYASNGTNPSDYLTDIGIDPNNFDVLGID